MSGAAYNLAILRGASSRCAVAFASHHAEHGYPLGRAWECWAYPSNA